MITASRRTVAPLLAVAALGAGLVACDSDEQLTTGPETGEHQQAHSTVEGRVESTQQTPSHHGDGFRPAATAASGAPAAEASTVAVAAVRSDGSLDVLAEARVQGDGSFTIDEVPAGRTDLVVVARSESGAEVGRVLVHGETEENTVMTTAPIGGETTVEGHVFASLTEAGAPEEIRSTARLALLLRMDESTADQVAASAQAIQEVSAGVRAAGEAMNGTFAATDARVDRQARAELMLQAAAEHARSRHAGAGAEAAAEAFVQAGLDALIQAGATAEEVTLATTAATTGLERAMAEAHEEARLEMAKNAVEMNLAARQRLVAEQPEGPSSQAAAEALARARADVEASANMSEVARVLLDAESSFEEELTSMVLAKLEKVPETIRAEVEARLETAFAEADFSAHAEAATNADQVVQAVTDYRERVRAAVRAFVDSLPAEGSVSARVSTELLVAVQGGPSLR